MGSGHGEGCNREREEQEQEAGQVKKVGVHRGGVGERENVIKIHCKKFSKN